MRKHSLKLWLIATCAMLGLGLAQAADPVNLAPGTEGSNLDGSERLCGNGNGKTIQETYANCKRGDIIGLTLLEPAGVMKVCDFSKTILYTQAGAPIGCVYTGSVRATVR